MSTRTGRLVTALLIALMAALFALAQEQEQEANEEQDEFGTLQIVWVTPGGMNVEITGPEDTQIEREVTGGAVFTGLPPGTYEVSASREGYRSESAEVEVQAGETTSIEITLVEAEDDGQEGEPTDEERDDAEADQDEEEADAEQEQEQEEDGAAEDTEDGQEEQQEGAEGDQQDEQEQDDQEQTGDQGEEELDMDELLAQGEQVYQQAGCGSCHGGQGGGGQGPAFVDNQELADTSFVASTIIHGRGGMPAFGGRLSDQEIASVATFIRNSWGNDFGPVSPEEVQAERE